MRTIHRWCSAGEPSHLHICSFHLHVYGAWVNLRALIPNKYELVSHHGVSFLKHHFFFEDAFHSAKCYIQLLCNERQQNVVVFHKFYFCMFSELRRAHIVQPTHSFLIKNVCLPITKFSPIFALIEPTLLTHNTHFSNVCECLLAPCFRVLKPNSH